MVPPGSAGSMVEGGKGGRFRSIQASGGGSSNYNPQMQNANLNIINQNGQNPNNSIDVGQLPMRLVNQKAQGRKV